MRISDWSSDVCSSDLELRVALLNGLLMGAVLGLIVLAWFHNVVLSLVIFADLPCNLLLAACAGVLIPVTRKRMGCDPALSCGIFLTELTDPTGFFPLLRPAPRLQLRCY